MTTTQLKKLLSEGMSHIRQDLKRPGLRPLHEAKRVMWLCKARKAVRPANTARKAK